MIPIGVAPRTDDATLTLVAKEEHWNQLFSVLREDYNAQKSRISTLKQVLAKGGGKKATLPNDEALYLLSLCGLAF